MSKLSAALIAKRKKAGGALIAAICDEDTMTGLLLAGIGHVGPGKQTNFLVVGKNTTLAQIEDAFRRFTAREDVAILLISQYIADDIRHLIDEYAVLIPTIIEIPSKDHPYDPSKDTLMARVMRLRGMES